MDVMRALPSAPRHGIIQGGAQLDSQSVSENVSGPYISWEPPWFPVDFPLGQSVDIVWAI